MLFLYVFLFFNTLYSSINIYFSYPNGSFSDKNIDIALKEFIDSSRFGDTLYICAYQIDNSTIVTSIEEAIKRGVKVYGIFDKETSLEVFKIGFECKKIEVATMHNKFMVLKSSKVWSGSYNFTISGAYQQNNFALEIFSKELAEIYEKAFLCMWGEDVAVDEFNGKVVYLEDNTKLTVYFNPYQKAPQLKDVIIELLYDRNLNLSKVSSIHFAYTLFTLSDFVEVFKKMKLQGVTIEGVLDDNEMNFYAYNMLKNAGVNVEFDKNFTYYGRGIMHHKFCVVDLEKENSFVICGSCNLSEPGLSSNGNYENIMIIESRNISRIFYNEFLNLKNMNDNPYYFKKAPVLITEVAINESIGGDWIEIFVLEDGNYAGWQVWSGYPKKKIIELPNRFYKEGEFILININSKDIDKEYDNLVVINSSENISLYNTEGFIYILDNFGSFIDAVGWSNRDGDVSKEAKLVYNELENQKMWNTKVDYNTEDLKIQFSLVDWSLHNKCLSCSIQRYKNPDGYPKDTNSLDDWFFSKFQSKGYGYKKVISSTDKILEVDKETNPFSPEDKNNNFVKINFNIPDEEVKKSVIIYDLYGKEIIRLLEKDVLFDGDSVSYKFINKGSVIWDGKDANGFYVRSGVYVVYLQAYSYKNSKKYEAKDIIVVYRK
ncbi:MAG: phospholipase D-like domain-containing protein [Elusimicrobiota bacterium]|nr:phospholipase D-like domain-containing protein [Endomicrobiia bacterium]MDW8165950.1 phospholipase D-like domain-containing protein [Elusimicrobiota bacterium]